MSTNIFRRTDKSPREPVDSPQERKATNVPMRSCCCSARPSVSVVMLPTADRPHTVDLHLCGHHYRAAKRTLDGLDAVVLLLGLDVAPKVATAD